MIRREITGPQAQFERTGAQGFRDVRPSTTRLSEALRSSGSGLILCGIAGATWLYPAALNLALPVSVLLRRMGSDAAGRAAPSPTAQRQAARLETTPILPPRKPRQAAGSIYMGRDALTGQELWLSNDDARQHAANPRHDRGRQDDGHSLAACQQPDTGQRIRAG